jgi:formate hydrogenlyase subunit 3/multisubunit Na+/H+ antiporter MnhD subunit
MPRFLVTLGLVLVALGLVWPLLRRLGLGRLPGDIVLKGDHTSFYFPIVTCLVASLVLSLIFWLWGR